jgi:hypothetical protein
MKVNVFKIENCKIDAPAILKLVVRIYEARDFYITNNILINTQIIRFEKTP